MNTNLITRVAKSSLDTNRVIFSLNQLRFADVHKGKSGKAFVNFYIGGNQESFVVSSYKAAHDLIKFYCVNGIGKTLKTYKEQSVNYILS